MDNLGVEIDAGRRRENDSLNPKSLRKTTVHIWYGQIRRVRQVVGERSEIDAVVGNDVVLKYGLDNDFEDPLASFLVGVLVFKRLNFIEKIKDFWVAHGPCENLVDIFNLWPCDRLAVRLIVMRAAESFVRRGKERQAVAN